MCLFVCFQLKGMIRVILEPLIGEVPLVGGVTFFFIRRPVSVHCLTVKYKGTTLLVSNCKNVFFQTLQINWTGMTNLLDTPAFRLFTPSVVVVIPSVLMLLT